MISRGLRKRPAEAVVSSLAKVINEEVAPVVEAVRIDVNKLQAPAMKSEVQVGLAVEVDWRIKRHAVIVLEMTLNEVTFEDPSDAGDYALVIIQTGGGNDILNWPANVRWPGGAAPTVTATDGRIDLFRFYWSGSLYLADVTQDLG